MEYVKQGRKVVVLRTFSKAHGLGGIAGRIRDRPGGTDFLLCANAHYVFDLCSGASGALAALEDEAHHSEGQSPTMPNRRNR